MSNDKAAQSEMSHVKETTNVPTAHVKQATVNNVALADALIKDRRYYSSKSAFRLYAVLLVVTLRK